MSDAINSIAQTQTQITQAVVSYLTGPIISQPKTVAMSEYDEKDRFLQPWTDTHGRKSVYNNASISCNERRNQRKLLLLFTKEGERKIGMLQKTLACTIQYIVIC